MISGLTKYLAETDKAANDVEDRLTEEICKAEGVTKALKKSNHMKWVAQRNNIKNRVKEIIYSIVNQFISENFEILSIKGRNFTSAFFEL